MKKWTNKEWDGTMFIGTICVAFIIMLVFTYRSAEFATAPTTLKVIEIIKDIFLIIAGFLFKRAADAYEEQKNGNGGKTNE